MAGDYAWSGREEAPSELPYDVVAQWGEAYAPQTSAESAGAQVDLSLVAQVAPENWLGLGAGRDLAALFTEGDAARRFADVSFQLPPQKLVVLSKAPHQLAPQGALKVLAVEIGARAAHIALLHSTLWSVPDGVTAATMRVEYLDGTRAAFDLKTGISVTPWQGEAVAVNARRGWTASSPDGTSMGLRVSRWENPFPAKPIARLHFTPVDVEAGYVLAGITLIDDSAQQPRVAGGFSR